MAHTLETGSPTTPRLPDYNSRRFGFSAGVIAATVMLVAIVVLRVISGVQSLPEIVAEGVLTVIPGALFSAVLDSLQHAAKPLFYVAVAIGMLLVGGFLGRWYGGDPTWKHAARIVLSAWLVFGVGVYTLLGAGIFGQHLTGGPIWHALTLLLVFVVFGAALVHTHALLSRRAIPDLPDEGLVSRRALLQSGGAALVALVAAGGVWRLLSGAFGGSTQVQSAPVAADTAAATTPGAQNPPPFDLKGLSPEVTRTEDFYTVSKNFIDPAVAVGGWKLKIDGLVDSPMELTYDQLTALPASEGYYTLMCISNEIGGDLWGNALWKGVKLRDLLMQAGVHTDAYKAVFTAADDYKDSVRLENALHPDALLAWEMNGAPLKNEHGFPARLLIPGIYGMKNVKWLTGITIVADDFRGFWQNQGWDDAAPYQTESRFDTPRGRPTVPEGPLAVGGVAYAGDRGIQSVEVSTDGGQTWQPAQVKPGLSPYAWQLWRADLPVDKNVRDLRVRATDGQGRPQVTTPADPFPSGATGLHRVTIAVQ
ncbi:MAG: molybdopterin-dependent oxidoreductase [Chloroflexi bacterium]|nr:molybdopterin-dependent oxidoreductase [Chloroflexota bacterium]